MKATHLMLLRVMFIFFSVIIIYYYIIYYFLYLFLTDLKEVQDQISELKLTIEKLEISLPLAFHNSSNVSNIFCVILFYSLMRDSLTKEL